MSEDASHDGHSEDDGYLEGAFGWNSLGPMPAAQHHQAYINWHRTFGRAVIQGDVKTIERLARSASPALLLSTRALPSVPLDVSRTCLQQEVKKGYIYNYFHLALFSPAPCKIFRLLMQCTGGQQCAGSHFTQLALSRGYTGLAHTALLMCRSKGCHPKHQQEALKSASARGNLKGVQMICEAVMNNRLSLRGCNVLRRAVDSGNGELVRYLVEEQLLPISVNSILRTVHLSSPRIFTYLLARVRKPVNLQKIGIECIRLMKVSHLLIMEHRYGYHPSNQDILNHSPDTFTTKFSDFLVRRANSFEDITFFSPALQLSKYEKMYGSKVLHSLTYLQAKVLDKKHQRMMALVAAYESGYLALVSRFQLLTPEQQKIVRFLRILRELPLDLQQVLVRSVDHLPFVALPSEFDSSHIKWVFAIK